VSPVTAVRDLGVYIDTIVSPRGQYRQSVLLGIAQDPECATFSATARSTNIVPCIGHYQTGPLQFRPSRYCWLPAKPAAICAERRRSTHLFSSGVRTHNPTAPGPSLVTCTGANPVSVVCSGISLCARHSTAPAYLADSLQRHQRSSSPVAERCRRLSGSPSATAERASGGCGASVELVCHHTSGPPHHCCHFGGRRKLITSVCRTTDTIPYIFVPAVHHVMSYMFFYLV